jgi:2-C-methyl-D-erythritol 2,4-cyclodiphosphate synthase
MRIGQGYDVHRLQPGGVLTLCGMVVSDELSPVAHSDGDVVLHALTDALLGAIGAGDIGEHFANDDPQWKSADSRQFVEHALRLVRDEGWSVCNADCLIIAERPKLKAYKPAMKQLLEELLNAPANVKAGTNEKLDALGAGDAVAAHAVVLLTRGEV